jgi:hypothetical protein
MLVLWDLCGGLPGTGGDQAQPSIDQSGPLETKRDGRTFQGLNRSLRLSENAHLLRYPHPSSLRRTSMYASFLGISEALQLDIFHQPPRTLFFDNLFLNMKHEKAFSR